MWTYICKQATQPEFWIIKVLSQAPKVLHLDMVQKKKDTCLNALLCCNVCHLLASSTSGPPYSEVSLVQVGAPEGGPSKFGRGQKKSSSSPKCFALFFLKAKKALFPKNHESDWGRNVTFDLPRFAAFGFHPSPWRHALKEYQNVSGRPGVSVSHSPRCRFVNTNKGAKKNPSCNWKDDYIWNYLTFSGRGCTLNISILTTIGLKLMNAKPQCTLRRLSKGM